MNTEGSLGLCSFWGCVTDVISPFPFHSFCIFFFKGSHSRQKKTSFLGDGQKLKDWHDKEAIKRDAQRVGTKDRTVYGQVPGGSGHCATYARVHVCVQGCLDLLLTSSLLAIITLCGSWALFFHLFQPLSLLTLPDAFALPPLLGD